MTLWDRVAAREETIGEPAQGEHLKGPALDRQCTGLSDRLRAAPPHGDARFCKSEFAANPQPAGTSAYHQDIEFVAQDLLLHLSAQESQYTMMSGQPPGTACCWGEVCTG